MSVAEPQPSRAEPGPDGSPVDHRTLRNLRDELGDDAAVDHFVADFLGLLDRRLGTIRELIRTRRTESLVTALLTVETSSLMVGADELAGSAARLRRAITEHSRQALVERLLSALDSAAERAHRALAPHPASE